MTIHPSSNGKRVLVVPGRVGLWLFLAVAAMVFAALISAYIVRMGSSDWQSLPKPGLLWVNTAILLLSSAALQWARLCERQGDTKNTKISFIAGAVLSALFLLGQIWAYLVLHKLGYFLNTNPSSSFFYLLTAVHGLHLVGGLIVAAWTVRSAERFQLFVTYWHFLTLVWVVLFTLIVLT